MASKNRDDRLDRGAWVEAALDLIKISSIENVRVEPLAKTLGVTKGSFYWHFEDRDELLQAMLEAWRKKATSDVIARLENEGMSTEATVHNVLQLSFTSRHASSTTGSGASIEFAIRDWARRDKTAARAVAEVDEQRIRFNTRLFKKLGFEDDWARARAFLIYCFNFGDGFITNDLPDEEKDHMRELCIEFLSQQ